MLDRRAFRLLLFRLLSFVRDERRTRGKIPGWTAGRAGTGHGRGTRRDLSSGNERTGRGIKLSYAYLRIFLLSPRTASRVSTFPRLSGLETRFYFLLFPLDSRRWPAPVRAPTFRAYFCIKLSTLTLLSPDFICNFKRRSIYE